MRRIFFAALALFSAGVWSSCTAIPERRVIRESVSPNAMTPRQWARHTGTYLGPIRSTNRRFGNEGVAVAQTRLDISGTAEQPMIFLKMDVSSAGSFVSYYERKEIFTNIPERFYGVKGRVAASTHAPDQLLLRLKAQVLSPMRDAFMIVTFRGNGCAEIDFVEHADRRGEGSLKRQPRFPGVCPE